MAQAQVISTFVPPRAIPQESARKPLFESVFLGGFECSCQRLEDGRRLDLLASTRHDVLAAADYARLGHVGMTACRDGVSWVHVEGRPGVFDFTRPLRMVRAARDVGVRVAWDLMHFGWPDDIDPFSAELPVRFGRFAARFATLLREEGDEAPILTPINEMSYLAWAGADVRCMNPFVSGRGVELKAQLVRATIEAIEAVRAVLPRARFLQPEPIIRVVADPEEPKTFRRVECDNLLQYQAWDMLTGRVWPSLGGHPSYLDIVGCNFYPDNQFMLDGRTVSRESPSFTPLRAMLREVWQRYRRPMILSETGAEGEARASWLRYVSDECASAMAEGCELHAITLYPVLNHHGWADDRHCQNGLWDFADERGDRACHEPLRAEVQQQTPRLQKARSAMLRRLSTDE